MMTDQRLRDAARPHGVVSQGCRPCPLFATCGGIEPEGSLFDCFQHYCCGGKDDCDEVCPYNHDYSRRIREVDGLRFGNVSSLEQRSVQLPRYVPVIHHGYCHRRPLDLPVVALDTYEVFKLRGKKYRPLATDGAELRRVFGLSQQTRIILRGTAKDRRLEQYWTHRRRDNAPEQMKSLNVELVIAPNFSHFLDVPRPDNLFNRKRQLICVTELAEAGLFTVPHLSAAAPGDWTFWRNYFRHNTSVRYVAAEFQTGNKSLDEGLKVIRKLSEIQDAIGRPLHPLIIGGTQFVSEVVERFSTFTIIDSSPFMKAVKRRKFAPTSGNGRWAETFTLTGQGVDNVILENVRGHEAWIERQCQPECAVEAAGTDLPAGERQDDLP